MKYRVTPHTVLGCADKVQAFYTNQNAVWNRYKLGLKDMKHYTDAYET